MIQMTARMSCHTAQTMVVVMWVGVGGHQGSQICTCSHWMRVVGFWHKFSRHLDTLEKIDFI